MKIFFYVCMRIRHLTNEHLFRSFYLYPSIVPSLVLPFLSPFSFRSLSLFLFLFLFLASVPLLSLAEHAERVNVPLQSNERVDQPIYSAYLPTHLPTYRHLFTVVQGARITPRIDEIASLCCRVDTTRFRPGKVLSRVPCTMLASFPPGSTQVRDNSYARTKEERRGVLSGQ